MSTRRCACTTSCSISYGTRAFGWRNACEQIKLEEQCIAKVEKMMRKPGELRPAA
jgi:hypothetical protein